MTKFIRIGIADKNDNPPYFDKALYEAEVDENEDIQHTVLTVTAKDHDECKFDISFQMREFRYSHLGASVLLFLSFYLIFQFYLFERFAKLIARINQ